MSESRWESRVWKLLSREETKRGNGRAQVKGWPWCSLAPEGNDSEARRDLLHYAQGSRSSAQKGWPRRSSPPRRCSGRRSGASGSWCLPACCWYGDGLTGSPPSRLQDKMQISSLKSSTALHTSEGGKNDGEFFFLSDNNLQFLQDTNYLAGTHCTVLDPERTSWESISPWENLFFKFCFPLCKSQSPPSRWFSTLLTAIPTINRLGSKHQLGPLETPACQSQFLVGRASICPFLLPFTERVNISWGLTPFSDFKIDFGEPGFQLGSLVVTWVAQGNGPPFLEAMCGLGGATSLIASNICLAPQGYARNCLIFQLVTNEKLVNLNLKDFFFSWSQKKGKE